MNKINLLYVGIECFEKKYKIPDFIIFTDYFSFIKSVNETGRISLYDIVILDRNVSELELGSLKKATKGYCLFATENVDFNDKITALYFEGKMGKALASKDIESFLENEASKYFGYSYGEKFAPANLAVNTLFKGKNVSNGSYSRILQGDFGDEFRQVAYWRYNIPVYEGQIIDLFLEYKKSGTVEIQLKVVNFQGGSSGDIKSIQIFNEEELQSDVRIGGDSVYSVSFMSILARGKGKLEIISLHDRHSRVDKGYFIPGGEKHVTPMKEEFFTYFEKGDLKPPFIVYFSGYRSQEGFEGYFMMRSFGCPFMLITDPRQEGGAFYVGDAEYERMLASAIKDKIKELGFTKKDVVFSGASMGTYGALYYGSQIMPHALVLAKPLVNMGNVAKNERIVRTEGFGTSIDQLKKNYGSLDEEAIIKFNERLLLHFDKADWSETKFIISYLYEDDYDPDGYQTILRHLKSSRVQVYGKGIHGRHTDNSATVMEWFKSQYVKIMEEDFGRR